MFSICFVYLFLHTCFGKMYLHDRYFLEMVTANKENSELCQVDREKGIFIVDMCALATRIRENLRRPIKTKTLYQSIREFFGSTWTEKGSWGSEESWVVAFKFPSKVNVEFGSDGKLSENTVQKIIRNRYKPDDEQSEEKESPTPKRSLETTTASPRPNKRSKLLVSPEELSCISSPCLSSETSPGECPEGFVSLSEFLFVTEGLENMRNDLKEMRKRYKELKARFLVVNERKKVYKDFYNRHNTKE